MKAKICNKCSQCQNYEECCKRDGFVYCIFSGLSCFAACKFGDCFFRCSSYVPFDVSQEKEE